MLGVYLLCLAVGGVLLLAAMLGGGDGDVEAGGESAEIETGGSASAAGEHDAAGDQGDGAADDGHEQGGLSLGDWLPLTNLRFWTFLLAFGGLVGVLLTLLSNATPLLTAALSVAMGYAAGAAFCAVLRRLQRTFVTSAITSADCIGTPATVLLPFESPASGQVRVRLKGRDIDLTARADRGAFRVGDEVLVYDIDDDGIAIVDTAERSLA